VRVLEQARPELPAFEVEPAVDNDQVGGRHTPTAEAQPPAVPGAAPDHPGAASEEEPISSASADVHAVMASVEDPGSRNCSEEFVSPTSEGPLDSSMEQVSSGSLPDLVSSGSLLDLVSSESMDDTPDLPLAEHPGASESFDGGHGRPEVDGQGIFLEWECLRRIKET
jgi:hypothetical protein